MSFPSFAPVALSIDPLVLASCYFVADILHQCFAAERLEYAALGLARRSRPLHVIAAPLLPGQEVTDRSVFQSGHDVLRMRTEVAGLARRFGEALVPVCMIHRHPGSCQPSETDWRFASEVFINQVAAAVMFHGRLPADCGCGHQGGPVTEPAGAASSMPSALPSAESAYARCFSLIVNARREYALFAVHKHWCPSCGRAQTGALPAELRIRPQRRLRAPKRQRLWNRLKQEIETKIRRGADPTATELAP